ncbi:hypothetical protein [Lederbergia panacisoli]|uniref:hypothetical protein n=1 Tax=Lederbergia panacisoli TaxID=1255251 RepID=UPI00214B8B44|nr:hypothetical protein [Lederbergia panacisoli]MCR2822955.1 hypothetical protein [Lederbergia panacisoli]
MKIFHWFVSLTMITFLFFTISPIKSLACSCIPVGTVQEEVDRSTDVFSGKVVEIVDSNKNKKNQSSADLLEVKFEVDKSWKGSNQSELIVYTERDSASCGFEFSLNEEYIVYANEVDGQLRVNLCSRTAQLTAATEDLNELGEGQKPVKVPSSDTEKAKKSETPEKQDNNNPIYVISTALGIGLAVGMVVAFILRGRKK